MYAEKNSKAIIFHFWEVSLVPWVQTMGFMHSCTTSWTSASSLFPVCHYWPNWFIQVCLTSVVTATIIRHTWI